jgi:hypothetical protein
MSNSETKEITMSDVKSLLNGLDPIMRKNVMSFTQKKSILETYDFIKHFLRVKGLDTKEGMEKYREARKYGCKGCKK